MCIKVINPESGCLCVILYFIIKLLSSSQYVPTSNWEWIITERIRFGFFQIVTRKEILPIEIIIRVYEKLIFISFNTNKLKLHFIKLRFLEFSFLCFYSDSPNSGRTERKLWIEFRIGKKKSLSISVAKSL